MADWIIMHDLNKNNMADVWNGNLENTRRWCDRKCKQGYEIWPKSLQRIAKTYRRSTYEMSLAITDFIIVNKPGSQVTFWLWQE